MIGQSEAFAPQWSDPYQILVVTEEIRGAHPKLVDYPLLPEDMLQLYTDGRWAKIGPGMLVVGFVLSEEQVQTLKPIWVRSMHLNYHYVGDVDPSEVDPSLTQVPGGEGGSGYDL